jgi:hypothetical protein
LTRPAVVLSALFSRKTALTALSLAASIGLAVPYAAAIPIDFDCAGPHSDPDACAAAQSPLSVTLDALGDAQVRVRIENAGPGPVVFTHVLFEGNALDAVAQIGNDRPEVVFREIPPWVLAVANRLAPDFSSALGAFAVFPSWYRGVGPHEALSIDLDIAPGLVFADVLDALAEGSLRIGIQAFLPCDTEFLVSVPVQPPIPEPGTFALVGLGLAGLLRYRSLRR